MFYQVLDRKAYLHWSFYNSCGLISDVGALDKERRTVKKEEKYYSIGKVSDICGVSVKTLRYYDQAGVLIPELRKDGSNYRYYAKEQLISVFIIKKMRLLGFSLEEIRRALGKNTLESMENEVHQHIGKLEGEILRLGKQLRESKVLLEKLQKGKELLERDPKEHWDVVVEEIPEKHLFTKRSLMESYRNEEVSLEKWIEVIEEAKREDLTVNGSFFITYHTELFGQFLQKNCDTEFGLQVEEKATSQHIRKAEGYLAATLIHRGEYRDIVHKYIFLKRWIEQNGYHISGNVTEEFIISPIDINNGAMHVTKIIIPIRKN